MLYPRLGLPLALELVNTEFASGGQARDALQTPADLQAWLTLNAEQLQARVTPETNVQDLAQFRRLRAALRELFTACSQAEMPTDTAVATVNAACAAAPQILQ